MAFDPTCNETAFVASTVRQAAQMAQRIQGGMAIMNLTKSDLSPATVSDFAIQAIVARQLEERFPDDVLVAEETSKELRNSEEVLATVAKFVSKVFPEATPESVCEWIDRGKAERGGRAWILDPIDGTRGYLRGGQYAVALALLEAGEVRVSGLGCPNLDENCMPAVFGSGALMVAVKGEGSWSAPLDDPGADFAQVHVAPCGDLGAARLLRSHEAAHTNAEKITDLATALKLSAEPVLMDSQAKYTVMAAGHGELLVRFLSPSEPDYREKVWDQAAGSLIVEEAGGRITDLDGKPLDFSHGRTLANNRGIAASNGLLHENLLAAIKQIGA